MIIGLVLSSFPGYSETFFRNKIKFLRQNGNKVIVFANNDNNTTFDNNFVQGFTWAGNWFIKFKQILVAVFRLLLSPHKALLLFNLNKHSGYSYRKNFLSLLSSAHILKFQLDWLHFGFATTALGKENLAKAIGSRMAVSIRGFDIGIYPIKHPNCYELLWQRIDKLHYISDELFKLALKNGISNEIPAQKITPAIDTCLFQGQVRSTFNAPLKFLTVARLNWVKGLEYTLQALSLIKDKGIEFEYTIIGDGEDYERLVFACYQLGIKEKVHFVGKKTPEEIRQNFLNTDIYLQFSINEGFCNALIEAQAMGVLCIASDAGALPENVLHQQTGWIVPKRNSKGLAHRILEVLNLSVTERERISRTAIERTKNLFSLERQKADFESFYQK